MGMMKYQTIRVQFQEPVCFIQFDRPEANNTINNRMIEECHHVLALCEESITIVVLEGLPEVFCFGADFQGMYESKTRGQQSVQNPESLYDLWLKLANGPYITISHVRGKANAGGVGFVAASDIVIADQTAQFSLSELLFGLFPACVLPFLIRRIGFQKANYMSLMTKPILIQEAYTWGLVDAHDVQSESLLRKHLFRLKCLSKTGILRYKRYMSGFNDSLIQSKVMSIAANQEVFSDPRNLENIFRYVEKGEFPWED
jgi:polyketide biosynthesis enoyl-CoA hydratase PksH